MSYNPNMPMQMPPQVPPPGAPGLPPEMYQPNMGQLPPGAQIPGLQPQQPPGSPIAMPNMPQGPGAPTGQPGLPGQPPRPGQYQTDPNLVRAMLMGQEDAPQQAALQRQQQLADRLRSGAPEMMRSQSRISTPNWAGALAGAAAGIKSGMMEDEAEAGLKKLGAARATRYGEFFKKLDEKPGQ